MGEKKLLKSNIAFIIYSFIAAAIIGLLLLLGLTIWLNSYTEHGKETQVPSVCGMYIEEAQITLAAQGLRLEIIDSTYTKKVPLGTIVEQNPPANANVKHGRVIYVIMNARSLKQIPLPELHDVSYRQAQATLISLGLKVDSISYEPSEYRDLVLDIRIEDRSIESGTRLPEGTTLTLVVGEGKGTQEVDIPDLKGQTLASARVELLASKLIVGAVNYDNPNNELNTEENEQNNIFYVYDQRPKSGQTVTEGSHIDLYLSTDPNKKPENMEEYEEDFF